VVIGLLLLVKLSLSLRHALTKIVIVRVLECTDVLTESRALVSYFSEFLLNDSKLFEKVWLSAINPRRRAINKFGASPTALAKDPDKGIISITSHYCLDLLEVACFVILATMPSEMLSSVLQEFWSRGLEKI